MNKKSTNRLIELAQGGDTEAWDALWNRYQKLCRRIVSWRFKNWDDVEDVLQLIKLRVWEGLQRFTPNTNYLAWLRTVCQYEVWRMNKRAHRRHEIPASQAYDAYSLADSESGFDRVEIVDAGRTLWRELLTLLCPRQITLLIVLLSGLLQKEAAPILDTSVSTINRLWKSTQKCCIPVAVAHGF